MNAVTVHMSDDMLEKVEFVAKSQEIEPEAFILAVMQNALEQYEARKRFFEYAELGRGREQEALELLQR